MTEYEAEQLEIAAAQAADLAKAMLCMARARVSAHNVAAFLAEIPVDDMPGVPSKLESAISDLSAIFDKLEEAYAKCSPAEVMARCAALQAAED